LVMSLCIYRHITRYAFMVLQIGALVIFWQKAMYTRIYWIRMDQYRQKSLCCCWHIWKRRNNIVFSNDRTTIQGALMACKTEAQLWRVRLPKKDKEIV